MTKTEYAKYLQSGHWRKRRLEAIADAGEICEKCSIPRWLAEIAYDQDLHVHHLSYQNLGKETEQDLEVLCRRCHEVETFSRTELRSPKRATCQSCGAVHWNYREAYCPICFGAFISDDMPNAIRLGREPFAGGEILWQRLIDQITALSYLTSGPSVEDILLFTAGRCAARGSRHPGEVLAEFKKAIAKVDFGPRYTDTDFEE